MIISGIIVGPNGLNILAYDNSIILLGTIGLLYIMFLAGLELDLVEFKLIKYQSFVFAFSLFTIGTILAYSISKFIFGFNHLQSIFIGILLIPFTLISYPIVSRLGLTREKIIALSVGAVVIADVTALTSITLLKEFATQNDYLLLSIFKFVLLSILFIFFVAYIVPRIAQWYFKNIEEVGTWQYIFVLLVLFATAFVAELAGLEPIIGAFAAGLTLNRFIPHNSTLMDRINFVGNSLFIPFFLIKVGMIIDLKVFFSGYFPVTVALILLGVRAIAIYFSTKITSLFFNYNSIERKLLFGITFSKAAATLAIALIGFNIGLFDKSLLNIVVVMILVSCLVASFLTERYGKQLAILRDVEVKPVALPSQKILVSVANPTTISRLIEFGIRIKHPLSPHPIMVLTIAPNDKEIPSKVNHCQKVIAQSVPNISFDMLRNIIVTSRASLNVTDGVIRAIRENLITDIVLGLGPKTKVASRFFGDILQNLLEDTNKTIYVFRSVVPLNLINNLIVFVPKNAEYEVGFSKLLQTLFTLSHNLNYTIQFYVFEKTEAFIKSFIAKNRVTVDSKYNRMESYDDLDKFQFKHDDFTMLVCIFSRQKGVSYDIHYRDFVERQLDNTVNSNFALFYPEQAEAYEEQDITHFDILDTSPIEENIVNIRTLVKRIKRLIHKNN